MRLSFMSTGELTLADKIAEDGRGQAMAGQAVRVLDIPADGGTGQGIFTCILNGWMVIYSVNSWLEPQDNFMEPHSEDSSNVLSMGSKNMSLTSKKRLRLRSECVPGRCFGTGQTCVSAIWLIAAAGEKSHQLWCPSVA